MKSNLVLFQFLLYCCFSLTAVAQKKVEHKVIKANEIEWGLLNPLRGDASPRAANLWGIGLKIQQQECL